MGTAVLLLRREEWYDNIWDKVSEAMGDYRDPKISSPQVNVSEHGSGKERNDDSCPSLAIVENRKEQKWNRCRHKSVMRQQLQAFDCIPAIEQFLNKPCPDDGQR